MHLLQVKSIYKKNERGFQLQDINFLQAAGHKLAISGETGSGKTTLLQIIAGLQQPDQGEVIFKNEKVVGPADKLIPGHKGIAYLSQDFRLPHFLRVEQILEYANEWPVEKAEQLFTICRIRHLFKRRTDELSGGEQQRIAIARLLIMDPQLFLLDEPFSNMDPANKQLLKNILEDLRTALNMSFIMTSHEPGDTIPWADEILVMRDGKIIEQGSPRQLYARPVFGYTASLLGSYNVVPDAVLRDSELQTSIPPTGMQSFIRPEHCYIIGIDANELTRPGVDQGFGASPLHNRRQTPGLLLTGIVSAIRYFGHYYETDVLSADAMFNCRSSAVNYKEGDKVRIQIFASDIYPVR